MVDRLTAEFRRLSNEALGTNNRQFLDLAKTQFDGFQAAAKGDLDQLLQPVKESLTRVDRQIAEIEKERVGAYSALSYQVEEMAKKFITVKLNPEKDERVAKLAADIGVSAFPTIVYATPKGKLIHVMIGISKDVDNFVAEMQKAHQSAMKNL